MTAASLRAAASWLPIPAPGTQPVDGCQRRVAALLERGAGKSLDRDVLFTRSPPKPIRKYARRKQK